MSEHYNAFISYKHAPEDNRVAEAIHKGLEHFHIPSKIRKKTGVKRINRIFRDKDELPITSDLSDSISTALADADYLIVICSTNTKESAWVPREIEYFLKNHTKKQIFTVLVNGEPVDVIPDILKYEEKVITDENGNDQTVRIPSEPLSCDYRMSPGKAKKTELPRLACGIIGCAYDELMNRRRQYRIKQLTAAFLAVLAIMAAFSGYMYYSRDRIRKTYLESLKNQSRYLANESRNLFEKEQRITALQLALEALPKDEEDERPVTPEAVRALTDATLAYETSEGSNIHAAWNYRMPNVIAGFEVSPDGKTVAVRDDGNVVAVWDTESHQRNLYLDGEYERISGMRYLDDERLLIWNGQDMDCYDTANGKKLWTCTIDGDGYSSFDDEDTLMVSGDSFYICTLDKEYKEIDSRTGKVKKTYTMPDDPRTEEASIVESVLSPDGKKIAFRVLKGWNEYAYGVFDPGSGKAQASDYLEEMVKSIEWVDNDTFMVASTDVDMKSSMSFGDREILANDHSTVMCIDAAGLKERWKADFVCNGVMIENGFVKLNDSVAFYSGNVVDVYDIKTGELRYSNNVNDSIIDVSDRDGDGRPLYLTKDGGYATPITGEGPDRVYYTRFFADDLRQVVVNKGVYARQNLSHEIIYYGTNVYDEEWTPLGDDPSFPDLPGAVVMDENYVAVLSEDDSKTPVIDVYGLDDKEEHRKKSLEGEGVYRYVLMGICDGKVYLGHEGDVGDEDLELVSYDIKEDKLLKEKLFRMNNMLRDACVLKNGKIIYTSRTDDFETILGSFDVSTGEKKEMKLTENAGYIKGAPVYYDELGIVCLQGDSDIVVDEKTGGSVQIKTPEEWAGGSCFSDNSDGGLFAVSDGSRILLADKGGDVKVTIPSPGLTPIGMTFLSGDLMVLFNDGSLNRYSKDTGEFLKNIDVMVYYSYNGNVIFDHDEDLLYIQMDDMCDVVDMKNGIEIANIERCRGHQRTRDIFVTISKEPGGENKIGYYKRYTVEELIKKARDILKDTEISEEMKSRYGIQ
ncbi:MAG: TIR domain-containing protein [Lachnospiraceae bacterium]|nr:TIR domain-containing protein [Lachnospiraceae bacterium]